jgi:hypothetical protein
MQPTLITFLSTNPNAPITLVPHQGYQKPLGRVHRTNNAFHSSAARPTPVYVLSPIKALTTSSHRAATTTKTNTPRNTLNTVYPNLPATHNLQPTTSRVPYVTCTPSIGIGRSSIQAQRAVQHMHAIVPLVTTGKATI